MKKACLIVLVMFISIASLTMYMVYDPPIHSATYDELIKIDDIGTVLAERIVSYLQLHPEASIDDLIVIEGIGEERIKTIKKEFD